ncbi:MAG: exodeoxyribonuclease VII small subunit [Thermoguttaceae bacterium]|nr:exodeoxyribonuclease VII small subunit [Thermoguttaceae bacterium]
MANTSPPEPPPEATATPEAPLSFEQTLERLVQLVRSLEEGRLGVDASLRAYEEGVRLLRNGHTQLREVEHRVELLTGVDENGQPLTTGFDESNDDVTLEEKARDRAKRRSIDDDSM